MHKNRIQRVKKTLPGLKLKPLSAIDDTQFKSTKKTNFSVPKEEVVKSSMDNISGDYNSNNDLKQAKLDKKSMTSLKKHGIEARTVYGSPEKISSKIDLKSLNGSKSLPKDTSEMEQSFNIRSSQVQLENALIAMDKTQVISSKDLEDLAG